MEAGMSSHVSEEVRAVPGVPREAAQIVPEATAAVEMDDASQIVEDEVEGGTGGQAATMMEEEEEGQLQEEEEGEEGTVAEATELAGDEETWQALLEDEDEDDEEDKALAKDDDYCPNKLDDDEDEEEEERVLLADLDFEAEKEAQRLALEADSDDDDGLIDDDDEDGGDGGQIAARKAGGGTGGGVKVASKGSSKKGTISPELSELMSSGAAGAAGGAGTNYSTLPSALAAEIFAVTIKKKMGGPTCDPDFAVPKKKSGGGGGGGGGKRKSSGSSSAAAKKQSAAKKRKGGWGPSSPTGAGGGDAYNGAGGNGGNGGSSKRSTNKQAIDLMHRSATAIPMSSVPIIFARVLKTLPPSDYDIYEIQNLIVTYALDEARYWPIAATTTAAAPDLPAAAATTTTAAASGEGSETAVTISAGVDAAVQGTGDVGISLDTSASATTTSSGVDGVSGNVPDAAPLAETVSAVGVESATVIAGQASVNAAAGPEHVITTDDIEERIYEDVMRLVTTDKKFLHRHVPVGHSSFSHVQTDAAMLKKYEAFLNSPVERSKRRDFLSEGGSARHGWTEDELERYAEALESSGGNIRTAARMLGTGLDRMHYFVFFYKRLLHQQAIDAADH